MLLCIMKSKTYYDFVMLIIHKGQFIKCNYLFQSHIMSPLLKANNKPASSQSSPHVHCWFMIF